MTFPPVIVSEYAAVKLGPQKEVLKALKETLGLLMMATLLALDMPIEEFV
ncbi:hypothetical protein LBMAG10_12210 [Actinomycetes bacterium]|nr:hypothetical protein LBMAG10_12210 [Actinomycetes bacterium]